MARKIDYYFSISSPWAYMGNSMFPAIAKTYGLAVNYKPVMLGELFAETGGLPLQKRHPARQRYRLMEMQRWREKRKLNFHIKPEHWPYPPRLADGVAIAIVESGKDPAEFLDRAYKACWEQQQNLEDDATLKKIADECGLDGSKLVTRAATDDITAKYEQNRQDAIEAGVFGSPSFVLDGEVFWGQDRIELLDDALKSGRKAYTSDI